jgi:anti-sigma B factor antagonist
MATAEAAPLFTYEIAGTGDEKDGYHTTITCHDKLTTETADEVKTLVKPSIARGGRIVLDFTDVTQVDSSGLGTLVGLKVSAVNSGYCTLELKNLSQRVQELLSLTKLTQLFS